MKTNRFRFTFPTMIVLLAQLHGDPNIQYLPPHKHPDKLPTDRHTWSSCCSERDCKEIPLLAKKLGGAYWEIRAQGFDPFIVEVPHKERPADKTYIGESENGKTYLCLPDWKERPSAENFYCAFYTTQGMN